MPVVEYEGQIHEFPDSFTDEDIQTALASVEQSSVKKPSAPSSTPVEGNQFMAGIRAGVPQATKSFGGTLEALGKTTGVDTLSRWGRSIQDGIVDPPPPRVGRFEDIQSIGDAVDWALYAAGSNIPQMGATVAGAIGGGLAGSALGPVGTISGAAIGSRLGAFTISEALNAGDIYLELKEKGVDNPTAALLAGLPIALLDMVTIVRVGDKVLFEPIKQATLKRVGLAAAEGTTSEAITEGLQESIQAGVTESAGAAQGFGPEFWGNLLSKEPPPGVEPGEIVSRILNAAAAGALVGGGVSAAIATPSVGPLIDRGMGGQDVPGDTIEPVTTPIIDNLPPPEITNPTPPVVPEVETEPVAGRGPTEQKPVIEQPPTDPPVDTKPVGIYQRVEDPGRGRASFDKPQGIYTTPADTTSPHTDAGGDIFFWKRNPNARVLTIQDDPTVHIAMRRGAVGAGAGVWAVREILGDSVFRSLQFSSREELIKFARNIFPVVEWERYFDPQEVMEGLGGMLARQKGYDAIELVDPDPKWTEFVGLTEQAMEPYSFVAPPTLPITEQPLPTPQLEEVGFERTDIPGEVSYNIGLANGKQVTVVDPKGRTTPQELESLSANEGFRTVIGAVQDVVERSFKLLEQRIPRLLTGLGGKNSFGGIIFGRNIHGVNRVVGEEGKVYINPFQAIRYLVEGVDLDPEHIASMVWHTIRHEVLHARIAGHNERFTSAATNVEAAFGAFNDTARVILERAYADPNNRSKLREDVRVAMETILKAQRRPGTPTGDSWAGQDFAVAGPSAAGAGQAGVGTGAPASGTVGLRPDQIPTGRAESRGDFGEAGPAYTAARDATWGISSNFIPPDPVAQIDRDIFDANEKSLHEEYRRWVHANLDRKLSEVLPGYATDETKTLRDLVLEVGDVLAYERWQRDVKGIPTVGNVGPSVEGVIVEDHLNRILEGLDVPAESRRNIIEPVRTYGYFHKNWMTLIQRIESVKGFEPAERFLELVRGFWASKTEITSKANDIIRLWDRLGKRGRQLSEFFFDVAEASMKLKRRLTPQELAQMALDRKIDEQMMEVYNAVDRHFVETILRLQELLVLEVDRTLGAESELGAAKIAQIRKEFTTLRNRNYFPFSRFGDHVVKVKALEPVVVNGQHFKVGDTITFEAFENKHDREARFKELKGIYGDEVKFGVTTDTLTKEQAAYQGFPPTLFETIAEGLDLNAQQRQAAKDMYISMLPQRSFAKHMKRRRGIAGFNRDAQRAYATYFQSASNHIAKLEYRPAMEQAVQDVSRFASQITQGNAAVYRDLYQNLADQLRYILNPVNELETIRGAVFTWFFAFVPKQVLVNSTQLPLFLYPYLAATSGLKPGVGDMVVAKEIAKAMADVTRSFDLREAMRISGSRAEFDPDARTLSELERRLMGMGVKAGFIGESFASEVAGVASGGNLHRTIPYTGKVDKFARRLTELGVLPFRLSEEYNRRVTFLAAVRMAQRRGVNDVTELFDIGRQAVDTTMFEYARWNRPKVMQGKKAVFFIFKSYLQHALHFAMSGPGRGRHWAMMMLFAGLSGLYGAEDLLDLLGGVGSLLGRIAGVKEPLVDLKKELREIVSEIGLSPDLFMSGLASSSFGLHQLGALLGLPVPALDFQSSLSSGRIMPGLNPLTRTFLRGTESVPSGLFRAGMEIAGPPAAIGLGGMNFMKAIAHDSPAANEYLTRLMPRQWRNISKAIQYSKGDALNSRGETLVTFDPNDPEHFAEIMGQALGLTPSRIVDHQEAFFAAREAAAFYQSWREGLFKDYALAIANKDPEAIRDVLSNVRQFNRNSPRGFAISADSLRAGVQTRVKNQQLRSLGLPTQTRFRQMFEDYRTAYPALSEARK